MSIGMSEDADLSRSAGHVFQAEKSDGIQEATDAGEAGERECETDA